MALPASALERNAHAQLLVLGDPKVGKAQPIDEPVLTPTGWCPIGELQVSDEVVGSNGRTTTVTGVFPQGRKPIVRLTTDDNTWTRCCEEHLWLTTTRLELYRGRYHAPRVSKDPNAPRPRIPTGKVGAGSVKSAALIAETIEAIHYLPALSGPVQFESATDLPGLKLAPYYLGLLLGDGSFRNGSVTWSKNDEWLLQAFEKHASLVGDRTVRYDEDRCTQIRITKLNPVSGAPSNTRLALIALELDGLKSEGKFIPTPYLFASPEMRLALLRGLCDTDGHAAISGGAAASGGGASQCEFSTSSPQLRDGVTELVRSLGGRAYVRPKETDHLPSWSIMISFADSTCPFLTPTKADRWEKPENRERYWRRRIESVEPDGEAACVCIKVAASDSLYVTRGHLLTHNTTTIVSTSPGPIRILNCDPDSALREAKRRTDNFDFDRITGWASMTRALVEAKKDVADGLKTIVIDPFSNFSDKLLAECMSETTTRDGNEDGRRGYPLYTKRLLHVVDKLFGIAANAIVICHYQDIGGSDIGGEGLAKTGPGIVPLLHGQARALVAARFNDVIFMGISKTPKGEKNAMSCEDGNDRYFITKPQGAWGPGCRSLGGDAKGQYPANIGALFKLFDEGYKTDKKRNTNSALNTQRR